MVSIKVILNNHLIKNILDYKTIELFDCFPKLKSNTLYSINCYYKYNGKYYTTEAYHLILFIYNETYHLYKSDNYYLTKIYNYEFYKEDTYKIDIKEIDDQFYNIILSVNKSITIHTNDLVNIYQEIDYKLKNYNYTITNIKTNCRIIDDCIHPKDTLNEIYIDLQNFKKKSFKKRMKEYFLTLFNKKNVK